MESNKINRHVDKIWAVEIQEEQITAGKINGSRIRSKSRIIDKPKLKRL